MQHLDRRFVYVLLLAVVFCSNVFVMCGEPYGKPMYESKRGFAKEEVKALNKKIESLERTLEETQKKVQDSQEEELEEVALPLSKDERDREVRKKMAKEAAKGATVGAGVWGAAHASVGLHNMAISVVATAKGTSIASGALIAGPAIGALFALASVGGAIGAAYGYAISD